MKVVLTAGEARELRHAIDDRRETLKKLGKKLADAGLDPDTTEEGIDRLEQVKVKLGWQEEDLFAEKEDYEEADYEIVGALPPGEQEEEDGEADHG